MARKNWWISFVTALLASAVVALGCTLIFLLIQELATPNYGFHGSHYDFLAFYTAGKAALHHQVGQLYDTNTLLNLQRQIIPHPVGARGYMPFLNPPFLAVLLAPLALLNINTVRLLWLVASLVMAAFIFYQLCRPLPKRQRWLAIGLLMVTFPMFQTFVEGQVVILVLLGGCLAYKFYKQGRAELSGASLVLLWVLPQFGLFAAITLLVKHQWKILKGWLIATVAVGLATLPFTGLIVYWRYLHTLAATAGDHFVDLSTAANLTWRGPINLTLGLNGFYDALFEGRTSVVNASFAITSVLLVGLLVWAVVRVGPRPTREQGALLVLACLAASILVNPHVYAQDAIIIFLAIPALFSLWKIWHRPALTAVILLAAFSDLSLVDQYSRLHLFGLGLIVILVTSSVRAGGLNTESPVAGRGAVRSRA